MSDTIKIGSLNLCLGIRNKKDTVKRLIVENNLEVLCLQETELPVDFPTDLLTFKGFNYESECNQFKMRCGIYVSNNLSYVRRNDLETLNMHVMIIDINDCMKTRLINVYRPFNPPNGLSQKEFFESQLQIIKNNTTSSSIVLGDFNLDHSKIFDQAYSHKNYFNSLIETFTDLNLIQIVTFNTWSRVVNNVECTSILDHIYVKNPSIIRALYPVTPPFGDHQLIIFSIPSKKSPVPKTYRRNWATYSPQNLILRLQEVDWNIQFDGVQAYWNSFESKLIEVTDLVAPIELLSSISQNKINPPRHIKTKINRRNRLLKKSNNNNNALNTRQEIKILNREIKGFFHTAKSKNVRKGIIPGNSKSLWNAVNRAKDTNSLSLPETLFANKIKIDPKNLSNKFAEFFSNKVSQITNHTQIDPGVYNGIPKFNEVDHFFMTSVDIMESIKSIKCKNSEGFDRIPQRILIDGAEILLPAFTGLFRRIYFQKKIPDQWSVAKVIPIHKKGLKSDIENYRPIANLCSSSKIFERLILKRISVIESLNNIEITGKQQHGFKKKKSTSTLSLQLQSIIARALDGDSYALMASVDLSAAFDVVNIDLLMTRLRIIGLPPDVIDLIEIWLRDRYFYVEVAGHNSTLHEINFGTIQGSILGPILYAIFVSPLFDLADLSNFADDNFIITVHKCKFQASSEMEIKLKTITKWLTDSGLRVNEAKTEMCLFYRKDTPPIEITLNGIVIKSKENINVLGIIFDNKLTWAKHVSTQINKSTRALHAIKLIRKYFNKDEILTLLTSNFYSILFYNSEVWHLPSLKPPLKQLILSSSAKALKLSQKRPDNYESYANIHKSCNRAEPTQMMMYKHAILLHKLYNTQQPTADWIDLNFDQVFNSRSKNFKIIKNNNFLVGNNLISSRLAILNNKVELEDLNLSLDSFKIKYKKLMLCNSPM